MNISIYVANLAAYNNGRLVGEWIDLPLEEEELKNRIQSILDAYPGEEYAILDYEAPFEIDEYDSPFRVNEWARTLSQINEDETVIKAIFDHTDSVEKALRILQNRNYRVYTNCNSMADVAYAYYEETGRLEEIERVISSSYIDWEKIGQYMEIEGKFYYLGEGKYLEIIF